MNAADRRDRTERAKNKRKRKWKEMNKWYFLNEVEIPDGHFRNNSVMNKYSQGWAKKTNTRKSCASYRHHGGYGKAQNWKPHDQRQIDKEKDYEEDV